MHTTLLELVFVRSAMAPRARAGRRPCPATTSRAGRSSAPRATAIPIVRRVPRFVQHELDADQARTRDSFGYEWTRLYPEHGHTTPEWQAERDIFLEYTRTVPSDFRASWCSMAAAATAATRSWPTTGARASSRWTSRPRSRSPRRMSPTAHDVDVVQADLFKLPFRPETFDLVYSVGVLHHTPDAKGAFKAIQPLVKPGGIFSIFVHGQGNRVAVRDQPLAARLDREGVVRARRGASARC